MGEPSRRQFLGAAAALAALPTTTAAATPPPDDDPRSPEGWGYREVATNDGSMDAYLPMDDAETTVAVGSYPEAVTLTVSNRFVSLAATLFPENVDELRAELAAAKGRLDPEEVAHYRELAAEADGESAADDALE